MRTLGSGRDRYIIGPTVAVVALAAWAYLVYEARRMNSRGVCACLGMKMGGPELNAWPSASLLPLFLMWAAMMVAMMLPSVTPMIMTFSAVNRKRRLQERPFVPVAVFAAGYIAVWFGFSVVAAVAQWTLHREALLSPAMVSASVWLSALLLLAAGVFQFTRLKQSCLIHCRGPLEFIMTRWREGRFGAFRMGLEHGAYCTGCCWALMALLFVAGVMNILWIAALTVLVACEKLLPHGRRLSFAIGLILSAWSVCMLVREIGATFT